MVKRFSMFGFLLAGILVLSACGGTPATQALQPDPLTEVVVTEGTITEQAVVTETATETEVETETAAVTDTVAPSTGGPSFSNDIRPILQASCTRCHGSSRQSGGLMLNNYSGLMAGSRNGDVVVPGDATNSILIQLVQAGRMPKSGGRLSDGDIQLIIDWVNAGALDN